MYDFHYNFMVTSFDVKLLFTDTGSLCYEVSGEGIYENIFEHKDLFDLSNFDKDLKFFDNSK